MSDGFQERLNRYIDDFIATAAADIAAADQVVICHEGGFGHQFHGPDLIRRFYAPARCLCIHIYWPGRNNACAPLVNTGIRVLHVPALSTTLMPECRERAADMVEWASGLARMIHERILRQFGKPTVNYEGLLHYVAASRAITCYRLSNGARVPNWVLTYYDLLTTTQAPRRRLPAALGDRIRAHLQSRFGDNDFVTLYLRQKGGDASSSARSGGDPVSYFPSIEYLRRQGLQVFIMGDVKFACDGAVHIDQVAESMAASGDFAPIMADLATLDPVNFHNDWRHYAGAPAHLLRNLLDLHLMTECRAFIGEAGGGLQLSPYEGVPTLNVNVLPYAAALPYTAHLFKIVTDRRGDLVPFQRLFSQHRWDYEFPDAAARENTPQEILDAVHTFIQTLDRHPVGVGRGQLADAMDDLWIMHCDGVISPAFFRIYERAAAS